MLYEENKLTNLSLNDSTDNVFGKNKIKNIDINFCFHSKSRMNKTGKIKVIRKD